jgi:hypothetical protein
MATTTINAIIAADAIPVFDETASKNLPYPSGKLQGTRKNPHVIDAGFRPDTTIN